MKLFDPKTGKMNANSEGYQQLITTLTDVNSEVSKQKFYEIPFADYVPTIIGKGAFKKSILNYKTFKTGEGFEAGLMNNGANRQGLAQTSVAVEGQTQVVHAYAKGIEWDIFELEEAMQANELFSLIEAKEESRKEEWDLGLQKSAFLGITGGFGLLNQPAATLDNVTIPKFISEMDATEFNVLTSAIYEAYRANSFRTAKPKLFAIPEKDFNGLGQYPNPAQPFKTKLQLLQELFEGLTGDKSFQILPCSYGDKANFDGVNNRYCLSSHSPRSVKFDIPLNYTATSAGTLDGFTWANAAYGQFSDVALLREREVLYFGNTAG